MKIGDLPEDLEPLRTLLESGLAPTVRVKADFGSLPDLFDSKFGGLPYLPHGIKYPHDSTGQPMKLLAQLNFSQIPGLPYFPSRGWLQIYLNRDEGYGLNEELPTHQDDFRILYFEDNSAAPQYKKITDLPSFDAEFDTDPFPVIGTAKLHFKRFWEVVPYSDYHFERFAGKQAMELFEEMTEDKEAAMQILEIYEKLFSAEGHKIGGYAAFVQEDPRSEKKYLKDHRILLLQVDSDPEDHISWAGGGLANFFMTVDDMKNRNFERVFYHWDS